MIGSKFGKLTVYRFSGKTDKKRGKVWVCKCECGGERLVGQSRLKEGAVKSCGCLWSKKHNCSGNSYKNKRFPTKEYKAWINMKRRCTAKETYHAYNRYGGRGIKVCDRWKNSFENFLSDMGLKPTQKHSLDRINPDGNYEPNNCRWATMKQQRNNRSKQ